MLVLDPWSLPLEEPEPRPELELELAEVDLILLGMNALSRASIWDLRSSADIV